jgi:hypothetical protein
MGPWEVACGDGQCHAGRARGHWAGGHECGCTGRLVLTWGHREHGRCRWSCWLAKLTGSATTTRCKSSLL